VTATAVIQTKQGIGDVMWHLPYIRAIAAVSPGGRVTFISPPSSHAAELLQGEDCIARVIYAENRGSELARGLHLARLVALLRRERFATLWILDRTTRPAFAAWVAGIPNRIGLGLGRQSLFITNRGIDRGQEHPVERLPMLMQAMDVPLATTEPNLQLPASAIAAIRERYGARPRPWVVCAFGASREVREWPHWSAFLKLLRDRPGTVFIIGGPPYQRRAAELAAILPAAVNGCDLAIGEATALMHEADLFIGPDSGPMNVAAAVGIPTFALFGASAVLGYSKFIHPIVPDDGGPPSDIDGMRRISAAQVLRRIEPYLAKENYARST
jgi:heptosyltransferase-2